jgi:hypothetical protein
VSPLSNHSNIAILQKSRYCSYLDSGIVFNCFAILVIAPHRVVYCIHSYTLQCKEGTQNLGWVGGVESIPPIPVSTATIISLKKYLICMHCFKEVQ